jgi:hypothetical protein
MGWRSAILQYKCSAQVTSVQIVGNLVEVPVSPGPGKRLREHRLIVQQVPVGRTGALNRRRRARLLRARRLGLRRAGVAGVEVHGGLTTTAAAGTAAATFVATAFTASATAATATAPASAAATSSAATLATALSTLALVVVGTGALWALLLRDLRRSRLLVLLVLGAMTALLRAMTTATAALLRTVAAALLLAMTATALLVSMTAAALLRGAVTDVALGLRALATPATPLLLGTALVGGGFFGGEFHGEAFGEGHFAFAALGGA